VCGVIALLGLLLVSAQMIKLTMKGLELGDLQHKSRSTEYFVVASAIVEPMMIILTCIEAQTA